FLADGVYGGGSGECTVTDIGSGDNNFFDVAVVVLGKCNSWHDQGRCQASMDHVSQSGAFLVVEHTLTLQVCIYGASFTLSSAICFIVVIVVAELPCVCIPCFIRISPSDEESSLRMSLNKTQAADELRPRSLINILRGRKPCISLKGCYGPFRNERSNFELAGIA